MAKRKKSNLDRLSGAIAKTDKNAAQSHLNGVQELVNTFLNAPPGRSRDKAVAELIKKDTDLQVLLAQNEPAITGLVEQALMQAATGYTYEEKKIKIANGRRTVEITTKQVPPNQAAIEFYLINKNPGEFSKNPSGEVENGEAAAQILEAIKNVKR